MDNGSREMNSEKESKGNARNQNTETEIENAIYGLIGRRDMPPKSINELEGRTTNFTTEMKREQSIKKKSRTSKKCGIIQKKCNVIIPGRKKRDNEAECIFAGYKVNI